MGLVWDFSLETHGELWFLGVYSLKMLPSTNSTNSTKSTKSTKSCYLQPSSTIITFNIDQPLFSTGQDPHGRGHAGHAADGDDAKDKDDPSASDPNAKAQAKTGALDVRLDYGLPYSLVNWMKTTNHIYIQNTYIINYIILFFLLYCICYILLLYIYIHIIINIIILYICFIYILYYIKYIILYRIYYILYIFILYIIYYIIYIWFVVWNMFLLFHILGIIIPTD